MHLVVYSLIEIRYEHGIARCKDVNSTVYAVRVY